MHQLRGKQVDAFVLVALCVLGLLIYSNTFDASFHADDRSKIVFNEMVHMKEFSWQNLYDSSFQEDIVLPRPVAYMSFALNHYYGGLKVFGYHLVNIIIHLIAGLGVYFLAKITLELNEATRDKSAAVAALAAFLWLASAVQTQAVTYIVQRMASMAAMFYIYSLLFYIRGRVSGGKKMSAYMFAAGILFLFALGTKQNVVTLPFIIVLYELAFLRSYRGVLRRKSFYLSLLTALFLSAGYLLFFLDVSDFHAFFSMGYGVRERLYSEARVIVYYISILLFPVPSKLALFHDFPLSRGWLNPVTTFPACIFVSGTMALALIGLRRSPFLAFFTLWFFINLLPEALLTYLDLMYEHRLYLPSVGFYILFSWTIFNTAGLYKGRVNPVLWCLILAIVVFFAASTYDRNRDWHDDLSLWKDNLKKAPMISRTHEGVGMAYLLRGRFDEAEKELKTAMAINPLSPAALGLGVIYFNRGNYKAAFKEFEYVSERKKLGVDVINPGVDVVFYKIGEDLLAMGRLSDAIKIFRIGLDLYPDNIEMRAALIRLEGRI